MQCHKDGKSCFWYGRKRWAQCDGCEWEGQEQVNKALTLCAACFEDQKDADHENDSGEYASCKGVACKTKTDAHPVLRDQWRDARGQPPVRVNTNPHPPMLQLTAPPPMPPPPPMQANVAPPPLPVHEPSEMTVLHAEVTIMRAEVKQVSEKMEAMMDIVEALRLTVEENNSWNSGWR